jgi:hypothetical protein
MEFTTAVCASVCAVAGKCVRWRKRNAPAMPGPTASFAFIANSGSDVSAFAVSASGTLSFPSKRWRGVYGDGFRSQVPVCKQPERQ